MQTIFASPAENLTNLLIGTYSQVGGIDDIPYTELSYSEAGPVLCEDAKLYSRQPTPLRLKNRIVLIGESFKIPPSELLLCCSQQPDSSKNN